MRKYTVLVVDDEHEKRKEGYRRLEEHVNKSNPGMKIEFDIVTEPGSLPLKVAHGHYAAAVVDAVLNNKWPTYSITQALRAIGDKCPIAILSERWDFTNAEQINEAWQHRNCRTFLHWRDIDPQGRDGQIDYAVQALSTLLADSQGLDTNLNVPGESSLRIVHISDVQTGGFDSERAQSEAHNCADAIVEHWKGEKPSFLVFTGDVTEHGSIDQYKQATEWIAYFANRLNMPPLPSRRVLYVPGNHDVNIRLGASSRFAIKKDTAGKLFLELTDKVVDESLLPYSYRPFLSFRRGITDCPLIEGLQSDEIAWVEGRFRHLGVVFYGFNTARPSDPFGLPGRRVSSSCMSRIQLELGKLIDEGYPHPLVIGLGHHCPVPEERPEDSVENPETLEETFCRSIKTALFLHGHTHAHTLEYKSKHNYRIVRSGASTLTKPQEDRPADSVRGFNLLELHRDGDHRVTALTGQAFGVVNKVVTPLERKVWPRAADGMFNDSEAPGR